MQRLLPLAAAVTLPLVLAGCSGGHGKSAVGLHCGLITSGTQNGRAVVTYDDTTGNAKMSAAIKAAVNDWNASNAPVILEPGTQSPSLTFAAANDQPALPPCQGTTPRSVTVTWNSQFWTTSGGVHEVLDPTGEAEHAIGHALGLLPGGKCPSLMAKKACLQRAKGPDAKQIAALARLYPSGSG